MALEHQHISVGDRIYIAKIDQVCTIRYKDDRSIVADPFLPPRLPLRIYHQGGKYDGLDGWHEFVKCERAFKYYH